MNAYSLIVRNTLLAIVLLCPTKLGAQLVPAPPPVINDNAVPAIPLEIRQSTFLKLLMIGGDTVLRDADVSGSTDQGYADARYYQLESYKRYIFVAKCDQYCRELELTIYDSGGNSLGKASGKANEPAVLFFTPRDSGRYSLSIGMKSCVASSKKCSWGAVLLAQR